MDNIMPMNLFIVNKVNTVKKVQKISSVK